ncbi:hypothetical protein DACRYDRAFT_75263 [Dacryopinax primogenitus]|uniref:Uncharacterized protein n=1 Tax=Dacryopinax primogenitus (strain DJM 731) TaxID=1858805 RepID=M5GAI2_DACPD|nr:uncharacterized protein DACRYDRAFT_75263 [Dacryopinax primogenitus]EJU05854.1 hypothetical protein DACRYDRAFT_75263 [Dacryopinax primogenitus]
MTEAPQAPNYIDEFVTLVGEMKQSVASARAPLKPLSAQLKDNSLDFTPGISLLTLKSHTMLSYMHSLVLLTSHKLLGHTLKSRTSPPELFSDPKRCARGTGAGDLVDDLIEGRVVLEKIRLLEGKLKYQIDKLVKAADAEKARAAGDDSLSFKPNLASFEAPDGSSASEDEDHDAGQRKGIYQPPRVAPMPYTEAPSKRKRDRAPPRPSALSNLILDDGTNPYIESASGLGSAPSMASARTRELERMERFEEENMTRLVMTKKESRRRAQDEANLALGGVGAGRRAGGLEEEFADVLRGIGEVGRPGARSDGYDELRQRGRKEDVLQRSRKRPVVEDDHAGQHLEDGKRKRTRFESELKTQRKNAKRRAH